MSSLNTLNVPRKVRLKRPFVLDISFIPSSPKKLQNLKFKNYNASIHVVDVCLVSRDVFLFQNREIN